MLHIEWIKVRSNKAFWALLLLYLVGVYVLCSIGTGLINMTANVNGEQQDLSGLNLYNFPNAWHNLTYIASFLKVFLGIMLIVNISNELQHKTLRQNIIDGMSEVEFILSKALNSFFLAAIATVFILVIGLYFGANYADSTEWNMVKDQLDFVAAFFLQTLTFLAFSLLIGLLFKSTGVAIVFLIAYSLLIENFATWIFFGSDSIIAALLPMNALDNLIQLPFNMDPSAGVQDEVGLIEIIICSGWLLLNFALSYFVLWKKDL
ncbi:MAG: ABC transporter permease subunit [Cyclobacteriaceae bacterium]